MGYALTSGRFSSSSLAWSACELLREVWAKLALSD
jgi:hypothetical protein